MTFGVFVHHGLSRIVSFQETCTSWLYAEYFANWDECNSIRCNVPYSRKRHVDQHSGADPDTDFVVQCLRDADVECTWIECRSQRCVSGKDAEALGDALKCLLLHDNSQLVVQCRQCSSLLKWIEWS
jgi:hypothetical protein